MKNLTNKLILGTVQLGMPYGINNTSGQPSTDEAFAILDAAHAGGVQTLDTADSYGTALERIGAYHTGLAKATVKFRIITKFHADESVILQEKARQSLSTLHVQSLYCYQFHRFADVQAFPHLYAQLGELKEKGIIERVGVSIYTNEEFAAASVLPFVDVIQFPFNLLDNMTQRGAMMRRAKDAGKELHIRSVFLQGLFFKLPHDVPPQLAPLAPAIERLQNLAESRNLAIEMLALNYALHNPFVDGVLFGVETATQITRILDAVRPVWDVALNQEIEAISVADTTLLNPTHWRR